MKDLLLVVVVLLVVAAAYLVLSRDDPSPEPVSESPAAIEPPESARTPPPIRYPVPPAATEEPSPAPSEQAAPFEPAEPLPSLDHSDGPLIAILNERFDSAQLGQLFIVKNLIRNFVVTIDNMTARKLPQKYTLSRPPPGKFTINKNDEEQMFLDAANYRRYDAYVTLAGKLDVGPHVETYVRFYPLFQQAYEELGYSDRYFNDRFVEVIDHLLEAPAVDGPVALLRPKVYYTYADAKLEALSAGQKILVRMGPENSAVVKAKLRELRAALIGLNQ